MAVEQLPDTTRDQLARLGAVLAETFGLVGLVGVDLVVDAVGDIAPIEVNPRPTASMELIERATGDSIAALHLGACGFASPASVSANSHADVCWAKAVLFAPCDVAVDDRLLDAVAALADGWTIADGWPAIADIPQPGQTIGAGRPLLTVFAVAAAPEDCRQRLMHRVETLSAIIAPALPA
jgi:predicted ATP-grasp superfamily ATP-dependent carboligase